MRLRGDNVILRAGVKRPTPSLGQPNHYGLESAKPAPQSMFEKAAARQWAVVEQPTRSAEDRFLAFLPFIGLVLAPPALEFTRGWFRCASSPLWGRTEEGGRAVLRDEPAMAHSIISSVRATPHPCPPPQEGAGALTPSILPKCSAL